MLLTTINSRRQTLKSSKQWWEETKADVTKLENWLQRQCHGEKMAYIRIGELAERFKNKTLRIVADQEYQHHVWVADYLAWSGIPQLEEHQERYWSEVNLEFENLEQAAAVGHHAEMMRLERIKIIAEDEDYPVLAEIFQKILKDELFHAEAFKNLTTEEELEIAKIDHEQGMIALGLTA